VRDGTHYQLPAGLSGEFGVVRVSHVWDGGRYANRFTLTPWAGYTTARRTPRHIVAGPVTAEVMRNDDAKHMGRLKVRYHWLGKDRPTTRWVRVAGPHAGPERGFAFLPEVGDEVLVAFEQGDPERPVVIGALWNGKDPMPNAAAGNATKRIVTRSGNTIQLSDEGGKETVEIYSAKAATFVQLANAAEGGGRPLVTVRSGGDIAFEAEGEIRLTCRTLVQRVASDAVSVVGGSHLLRVARDAVTKAGASLTLQGMNATIKASANIVSQAGAINNVAGTMVHIQPPGLVAPDATVQEPAEKPSVWRGRPVPKKCAPIASSGSAGGTR
jgi:uncharacterized protein involved in type VI secretion and phage assembly